MANKEPIRSGTEETFGEWFRRVWGTYCFKLLGANLLFLVFSIPVITIPAALCGLNAVVQCYYRELHGNTVIRTFTREFLDSFFKRTVLCVLVLAVPVLAMILLKDVVSSVIWLVLSAFLLTAALITLSWFIPQLVFLNLSPLQALKNAFVFMCTETTSNFCLIALHAVCLTVMVFCLPASMFLLVILPVLSAVIATGIVMPVLKKYLVWEETPAE